MERHRLAKEIHDELGPLMSTIRLHLDAVKEELADGPPKILHKIDTIDELVRNVAKDIRNISHSLMPNTLIDFGLVEALKQICEKVQQSGLLQIEFHYAGMKKKTGTPPGI